MKKLLLILSFLTGISTITFCSQEKKVKREKTESPSSSTTSPMDAESTHTTASTKSEAYPTMAHALFNEKAWDYELMNKYLIANPQNVNTIIVEQVDRFGAASEYHHYPLLVYFLKNYFHSNVSSNYVSARLKILQEIVNSPYLNANLKDDFGSTALIEAISQGMYWAVKPLLDKGADIYATRNNCLRKEYGNAFTVAISRLDDSKYSDKDRKATQDMCTLLLKKAGKKYLDYIMEQPNDLLTAYCTYLAKYEYEQNKELIHTLITKKLKNDDKLFWNVCSLGCLNLVNWLLDNKEVKVTVNKKFNNKTVLGAALTGLSRARSATLADQAYEVCTILIKKGFSLDNESDKDMMELCIHLSRRDQLWDNNKDLIQSFISKRLNKYPDALLKVSEAGSVRLLNMLLDDPLVYPLINTPAPSSRNKCVPLLASALSYSPKTMSMLLDRGANIRVQTTDNHTLHKIVQEKYNELTTKFQLIGDSTQETYKRIERLEEMLKIVAAAQKQANPYWQVGWLEELAPILSSMLKSKEGYPISDEVIRGIIYPYLLITDALAIFEEALRKKGSTGNQSSSSNSHKRKAAEIKVLAEEPDPNNKEARLNEAMVSLGSSSSSSYSSLSSSSASGASPSLSGSK